MHILVKAIGHKNIVILYVKTPYESWTATANALILNFPKGHCATPSTVQMVFLYNLRRFILFITVRIAPTRTSGRV